MDNLGYLYLQFNCFQTNTIIMHQIFLERYFHTYVKATYSIVSNSIKQLPAIHSSVIMIIIAIE